MDTEVKRYLERRREQNLPALLALERGAAPAAQERHGVVLYEESANLYYISADDNATLALPWWDARRMAECLVLRENNIDSVRLRIHARMVNRCRQIIFLGDLMPVSDTRGVEILPLGPDDLDFVCEHYQMNMDRGYVQGRLSGGHMIGAYCNGVLTGFAGIHSDGSLGMLEVLPEYRRLHIGTALGHALIRRAKAGGRIPYAHILVDNHASLAMTLRIPGARTTDEVVAWLA